MTEHNFDYSNIDADLTPSDLSVLRGLAAAGETEDGLLFYELDDYSLLEGCSSSLGDVADMFDLDVDTILEAVNRLLDICAVTVLSLSTNPLFSVVGIDEMGLRLLNQIAAHVKDDADQLNLSDLDHPSKEFLAKF